MGYPARTVEKLWLGMWWKNVGLGVDIMEQPWDQLVNISSWVSLGCFVAKNEVEV